MQKRISFCLLIIIFFGFLNVYAQNPQPPFQDEKLMLSEKTKKAGITIVEFLPLPRNFEGGLYKPHERVFTDEFYSSAPRDSELRGYIIPRNYLQIINNTIRGVAATNGLDVTIVKSITQVSESYSDIIVLGSVRTFLGGKGASVTFKIQLLDAKNLKPIASETISRDLENEEIPFIVNLPVHMIGNHANDFHPQKTVLSLATYLCVKQMFRFIDERVN